jgi:deoxyribose-phosphate aldolase
MDQSPTKEYSVKLTVSQIARMIDLSAVRAESDVAEVRALAECARKHQCMAAFALPSQTPLLVDLLADEPAIAVGGVVGFPSGGVTTSIKAAEARELLAMGCNELDMVVNIGMLRSGRDEQVRADIRAVVEAGGGAPVKVILECHHLTDEQIRKGCELSVAAGAAYVKTGTGWAPTGGRCRRHQGGRWSPLAGNARRAVPLWSPTLRHRPELGNGHLPTMCRAARRGRGTLT